MRDLLIGLLLLASPAAIFVVFGAPGLAVFDDGAASERNLRKIEDGRIAYVRACARCHGRNARGTAHGTGLLDPAYAPGRFSDARLHETIRNGAHPRSTRTGMAVLAELPDDEAALIVAFLRDAQQLHGVR